MSKPIFKTREAREKIINKYNELLTSSGFEENKKSVETIYGKTSYVDVGAHNKKTIILLHGSCSNSAMWFGDLPILAKEYRVIALDIIGEAGDSEEVRLGINSQEYALWIQSFIDNVGLKRVILAGNSFGGWLALKFATNFGERVAGLILIASSGIVPVRATFLFRCVLYLLLGRYGRLLLNRMIFGMKDIPEEVTNYSNLIIDGFNPMVEKLPAFSENDFKTLQMPLLFIVGENDVTMSVDNAVKKISLASKANIKVLKNSPHVIANSANYILDFMKDLSTY